MSARGMNKRPAAYNQRVARIQAFDDIEHQIRDIINNDQSTRSKIQQEFDGTDKSARDAYRAAVANNQAACKELGARNRRTAENLSQIDTLRTDRTTQNKIAIFFQDTAASDADSAARVKAKDLRDRLIQLVKDLGLTNTAGSVSERQSPAEAQRSRITNFLGDSASNEGYTHTELFNLVLDKAHAVGEERQTLEENIEDLDAQLSVKDTEWQVAVDKLQKEHDDKLQKINEELKVARTTIEQHKKQIKKQGNDNKDLKEKVEKLERELQPFHEQLADLPEESGATAKDRLHKAFTSLRTLTDSHAKKEELIKELEGKLSEYEYDEPGDEDALLQAESNAQASELRQKLDTATKQVKKLEDDGEERRRIIAANNDKISKLSSDISEAKGREDSAADVIIAACGEAYGKQKLLTWEAVCRTKVLSRLGLSLSSLEGREIVDEPGFSFVANVGAIAGMGAEHHDSALLSWAMFIVEAGSTFTSDEHFGNMATIWGFMHRGECNIHLLLFINQYLRSVIKLEDSMLKIIGLAVYTDAFKMMPHHEAYQLLDMANIVGLSHSECKPSGYLVATAFFIFLATLYQNDKEAVLNAIPTLESSDYLGMKLDPDRLAFFGQEFSGFIPLATIDIAQHTLDPDHLVDGLPQDVYAFKLPRFPPTDAIEEALFYREVAEPISIELSSLSNRELLFSRKGGTIE